MGNNYYNIQFSLHCFNELKTPHQWYKVEKAAMDVKNSDSNMQL